MKKFAKEKEQDPDAVLSAEDENFLIEYECLIQLIALFAETCLHRNKENQKKLAIDFDKKILSAIF